jgi:hypothetical protein
MAHKISRKLKKAEKAVAAASKVLNKAEKKRDAVLLREAKRADRQLAKRVGKDARPASAPKAAIAKRAASKPVAKPAAKPAAVETAAAKPAAAKPAAKPAATAATPAFGPDATVADLREAAKANEISGYSRMTKAQLIEALA